jgi:hypothetical protein
VDEPHIGWQGKREVKTERGRWVKKRKVEMEKGEGGDESCGSKGCRMAIIECEGRGGMSRGRGKRRR